MIYSKDFDKIKELILPYLPSYDVSYRHYPNGDFGTLDQIIFDFPSGGGGIDIWGSGYLGIDFVNYISGEQEICIMIESNEENQKESELKRLITFLKSE